MYRTADPIVECLEEARNATSNAHCAFDIAQAVTAITASGDAGRDQVEIGPVGGKALSSDQEDHDLAMGF